MLLDVLRVMDRGPDGKLTVPEAESRSHAGAAAQVSTFTHSPSRTISSSISAQDSRST
jgi:hypothetical protein